MSAGDPTMSAPTWQWVISVVSALGLGSILTAVLQRPSRRNAEATAVKDEATGAAAVIAALSSGFTEVSSSLRKEIERLQALSAAMDADLAAAHDRAVALEDLVERLTEELEAVKADRDEWKAKAELLAGEVRQLQQVLASKASLEDRG